jgi:methanogenic corrinoid protein MtbC1
MVYSISDLEQLSGVQSHTIRIWEQRYQALKPDRSDGNTRMYNEEQLKRLLNIVSLNQSGLKISKICSLSKHDFNVLLDQQLASFTVNSNYESIVSQLIKYGISFDVKSFSGLLDRSFREIGPVSTYQEILYPLLVKLGLMWSKDDICPAHEHFISNIIRQKLFAAINELPNSALTSESWLLFLPEDEDHDIGLLLAAYMLRLNGKNVIFFGGRVPLASIKEVLNTTKVNHVLLFMMKGSLIKDVQNYVNQLSDICSNVKIHLSGNGQMIGKLNHIEHINWCKTLVEFEEMMKSPTIL